VGGLPAGDDAAARATLETWFVPFKVMNNDRESGLFTGYYEAELRGALAPDGTFKVPLYGKPADMIGVDLNAFRADLSGQVFGRVKDGRLVPYFTRAEIDDGAIGGQRAELLWSDDPVDVFFLHVQGSGQVTLPDGTVRRVGFAASNGREFYPIGRALLDEGKVSRDNASMQAMRAWLRANPAEAAEIMRRNTRYIFFRWIDGDGPIGSQGVALTPGRSLAVDPAFLPLGVPVFLETTWPGSDRPLRRLLVAQDTGSAIKGPLRGDFFWGSGEPALAEAGRMKQSGKVYILLPKPVAERRKLTS
jgi:membrane-bound lytic murein transglycosylase A